MSRGLVVVVKPARVPESGITGVFKPLFPLFAADALDTMKHSGCSPCRKQEGSMTCFSPPP